MPKKILLIEDSGTALEIMKAVFEDSGYNIVTAVDGRTGIEKAKAEKPDIVIIDTILPDINGFEVCQEIRREKFFKPVYIIITTGNVDAVDAEQAREVGADDYVVKTFESSYLLDAVKNISEKKDDNKSIQRELDIRKWSYAKTNEAIKILYKELENKNKKLEETQEQLIQMHKMAALGQLAEGVSHELKQPLFIMRGNVQLILMDDKYSAIREDLKLVIMQVDRMTVIINTMIEFNQKSSFDSQVLDINLIIRNSLLLFEAQLEIQKIGIKVKLEEGLPKMKGDSKQLYQVLMNIISNATHALRDKKGTEKREIIVKSNLNSKKNNLQITIADTGTGISSKNLKSIFNPFFTTKAPDGGIGLGLSIVYNLVCNHGGDITVESEEGKGTVFILTFPVFENEKKGQV